MFYISIYKNTLNFFKKCTLHRNVYSTVHYYNCTNIHTII